jgi:hypothetical protein
LLRFIDNMITKDSYFSVELSAIILASLQALAPSEDVFILKSKKWYSKLIALKEYNQEDLVTFLKSYPKPTKYIFLQYAFETSGDKSV